MNNTSRFRGIDAARGLAALAVLSAHCIELSAPKFFDKVSSFFLFGVGGVYLFFLISGFVIPISLTRISTLGQFVVGRVSRLYPMYLCSVVGAFLTFQLGVVKWWFPKDFGKSALMNLSMVQEFLGFPSLIGAYWSLGYEVVFYCVTGLMFVFGFLRNLHWMSVFCSVIVLLLGGLSLVRGAALGGDRLIGFVFMFLGTSYFGFRIGNIGKKALVAHVALALAGMITQWTASIILNPKSLASVGHIITALVIVAIFGLVIKTDDKKVPDWMVKLGTISFSIYLNHGLILYFIRPEGIMASPALHLLCVGGVTLGLSFLTYRLIELPAMKYGKALSAKLWPRP